MTSRVFGRWRVGRSHHCAGGMKFAVVVVVAELQHPYP